MKRPLVYASVAIFVAILLSFSAISAAQSSNSSVKSGSMLGLEGEYHPENSIYGKIVSFFEDNNDSVDISMNSSIEQDNDDSGSSKIWAGIRAFFSLG